MKKHSIKEKHQFNFENVKILGKETNTKAREFLEMIKIKKQPNAINDRIDIKNLSKIYNGIL